MALIVCLSLCLHLSTPLTECIFVCVTFRKSMSVSLCVTLRCSLVVCVSVLLCMCLNVCRVVRWISFVFLLYARHNNIICNRFFFVMERDGTTYLCRSRHGLWAIFGL